MKQKLSGPRVWSPCGKEIIPHVGGIVPAGSFIQKGESFEVLPQSQWIYVDNGTDDIGRKYPPSYGLRTVEFEIN